jgi:hypothetical protein
MFTSLIATTIILLTSYSPVVLSEHQISMENRQPDRYVNQVFKDNILLNVAYLENRISDPKSINWEDINNPYSYQFTLKPGETFAFHDSISDKYINSTVKTSNAHFNGIEGFKSDGYLMGDGVCHLASLFYWVAKDAGLLVEAPSNHDFAVIPEISKENGVAIYSDPNNRNSSSRQNLYITNNKENPVTFVIIYNNNNLKISVTEEI